MTYVEFDNLDDQQQREVFRVSSGTYLSFYVSANNIQRVQLGVALNVSGALVWKHRRALCLILSQRR